MLTDRERGELRDAWVQAIRSLTSTPDEPVATQDGIENRNFIVLNDVVYDAFTHRIPVAESGDTVTGVPARVQFETEHEGSVKPEPHVDFFPLPSELGKASSEDVANQSIDRLMGLTLSFVSDSLRTKLSDSVLVIIPFSRPYLNSVDFKQARERIRESESDGDLFS